MQELKKQEEVKGVKDSAPANMHIATNKGASCLSDYNGEETA